MLKDFFSKLALKERRDYGLPLDRDQPAQK